MKRCASFAAFFILLFTAVVTGHVPAMSSGASNETKPLIVGAILPFTGAQADIASEEKNAIEMALNDTGRKFKVIYEDSVGQNQVARAAFHKLVEKNNASVAITCASWISNVISPLAANRGILQFALGTATFNRTNNGKAVVFTVSMKKESEYLANYLQRFNRIAIIYMNNDYGRAWSEILETSVPGKVVSSERYELNQTNYSSQLTKIKATKPDVLVLISSGEGASIARQARQLGINASLASTRPIERPDTLKEPAVDRLVYSYPSYNTTNSFFARYAKKYSQQPTAFGAEAYDAIVTLASAAQDCRNQTDCICSWYLDREFNGALGKISFDRSGNAHYPVVLKQIRNGKLVSFEIVGNATTNTTKT
ncbi:MAG: ABC transporter substrate-binding protein [Methanotrichaceae archaeon]|nr:ABC transporter substrate-binding protein [Methanotrichaceae archaeon]